MTITSEAPMSQTQVSPAAKKEVPALGHFEDDPVWGTVLRVKGLGDGLSQLAEVEPVQLRRGERVALVVEAWVDHVGYPPGKSKYNTPGVNRLHVLRAGHVTIVDPSTVQDALDMHQLKLDEAAKQRSLFAEKRAAEREAAEAEGGEDDADGA